MMGFTIALSALVIAATPAPLVGDWGSTDASPELSFRLDGTGQISGEPVLWFIEGDRVRVTYADGSFERIAVLEATDFVLVLRRGEEETLTLARVGKSAPALPAASDPAQLIGTWGADGQPELQFAADGAGIAYSDRVQWTVTGNMLRLRYVTGASVATTYAVVDGGRFLVLSTEDADGNPAKLVLQRVKERRLTVSAR